MDFTCKVLLFKPMPVFVWVAFDVLYHSLFPYSINRVQFFSLRIFHILCFLRTVCFHFASSLKFSDCLEKNNFAVFVFDDHMSINLIFSYSIYSSAFLILCSTEGEPQPPTKERIQDSNPPKALGRFHNQKIMEILDQLW
jgi:hypothetical protein